MRGVLNVEGYFAIAWLLALFFRSRNTATESCVAKAWWLLLLSPLPFLSFLSFPFLADDYPHILHAHALSWGGIPSLFTVPAADQFFRPVGYLSYALDAQWAGLSPTLWRLIGLAIHLTNTLLLYALLRELQLQEASSLAGAFLFAIHGSRPEAVTWVSARFDLLAVLFALGTLLLVLRRNQVLASLCLFVAALSKESAFIVPLLAALVLWYAGRFKLRLLLPLFGIAMIVFAYRWALLGGMGGYHNAATGLPTVFDFKLTSTLQALFPRFWAAMLFPINWTNRPGPALLILMAFVVVAYIYLAIGRAQRRTMLLGVAFAYICAIPVHQFLSIGPDLEKSRVLYFASTGLAIVFAAVISSRRMWIPAAAILLFQCAALEHNLQIWKRVGYQAQVACVPTARDLPNVVDGVYFLHTGFPECLQFK